MTITETRPEAAPEAPAPAEPAPRRDGLASWLTTGDHKRVGRLYVVSGLVMSVGLLVVGGLMSAERISGGMQLLDADSVYQLVSLYRWGFALGVAAPMLLGLAIAIVPLQVGARSVAFPRAAALSFWTWILGTGVMVGAYIDNGGPGGGGSDAVDLFLAALFLMCVALVLGSICVATTVLALRAPGMTMRQIPVTAWAGFAGALTLVLSLAVLAGEIVLLYADHRYGRIVFGGNLQLGEWIDWALNPLQLYAYAVIGLGVVADVVTTTARRRSTKRGVLTGAIGLAAIFAFGADIQVALRPTVREELLYIAGIVAAALALLVVLAAVSGTLAKGDKRVTGALVFTVSGLLMILVGTLAGILTGVPSLELVGETYASDTIFSLAVFNQVVLGVVLVAIGGLAHWGPKLWGRMLPDKAVMGLGVLGLIGVVLTAFPNAVSGFLDQPLSTADFDVDGPTELLNALSTAGYAVVVLVVLAFALLAVRGFSRGEPAGDDPWDGSTLEWETSSPPPPDNFARYPEVGSAEPLLDVKEA